MTGGEKSFTKTACMRVLTFAQVKKSMITNGFGKAGLVCDEEDRANLPRDETDIESDNKGRIV